MVSQQHGPAARPPRPPRRHRAGPRPICLVGRNEGFDLATVLPLVRKEVRRFRPWRLENADLMQAGVAGALEAWRRRDTTRGAAFGAYASSWVRKELQQTVARGDFTLAVPTHVPPHAVALRRHLDHGLGVRGAGRRLGLTPDQAVSLERLLEATDDRSALLDVDRLGGSDALLEDVVLDRLDRDAVRRAVAGLAEPQRSVVILRFGFDGSEGRSTREIGRLVGVSDFTVRAQLKQATAVLGARLAALRNGDAR